MAKPIKFSPFQKAIIKNARERDASNSDGATGRADRVIDAMQAKHDANDGTCTCRSCA